MAAVARLRRSRPLLALVLLVVLALVLPSEAAAAVPLSSADTDVDVHTVHLVFSHHLDIGLNKALRFVGGCSGFATKIVQQYFDDFIPKAIALAAEVNAGLGSAERADGRFAYTLHPWIASLYVDCVAWDVADGCPLNPGRLHCPNATQVAAFDAAVRRGELLWADSPFNINSGVVGEPGMFEALFDIAAALNERYNLTKAERVWSNVDVPGFARSAIPLLKRAGASALSVCANVGNAHQVAPADCKGTACTHTSIPAEFLGGDPLDTPNATMWRWHDPVSDEEILVLYHKAQRDTQGILTPGQLSSELNTYGGYTRRDNTIITAGGTALATYIAADNTGPPLSTAEVRSIFQTVKRVFPRAKTVFGSTWDKFVGDITPHEVAALPLHSSAWGDQ